jgi:predicted lipoprotein with Yx(FWY)xxD motif
VLPAVEAGAAVSNTPLTASSQTIGKLGKVLVVKGRAAYTLAPSAVACGTECLKIWPAISESATIMTVNAGNGVQQSKLGVTTGPGGTHQLTYNGQPIYYFYKDTNGKVKGNITDKWGKWRAVVVAKAKNSSGSGGGSSSNSGGSSAGGGGVNF